MGSVMVTGTRTMSTFMRMSAPGRALAAAAPVTGAGCTPAGAVVEGKEAGGGVTWTLLRGSSWARAGLAKRSEHKAKAKRASGSPPECRRLRYESLLRLICVRMWGHLRLNAILARLTKGWRHGYVTGLSTRNQSVRRRKTHSVTEIQSSLCAESGGRLWAARGSSANPSNSIRSKIDFGYYLSISRLALQSFRGPARRRGHATV